MSVFMKVFHAMNAKDIVAVEETLHDDFVYFDNYEIRTRDEWLKGLQEFWKMENRMHEERRVLCDSRDCYVIERNNVKDGIEIKVTFMALLKKYYLWRSMIHRAEG